jgi:hypothetical protein
MKLVLPLPRYAFMPWCPVKAQGHLYFYQNLENEVRFDSYLAVRTSVYKEINVYLMDFIKHAPKSEKVVRNMFLMGLVRWR